MTPILETLHLPLWMIIALCFFLFDIILLLCIKKLWQLSAGMYITAIIIQAALNAVYQIHFETAYKIALTFFAICFTWILIEMDTAENFDDCMTDNSDFRQPNERDQIEDIKDFLPDGITTSIPVN